MFADEFSGTSLDPMPELAVSGACSTCDSCVIGRPAVARKAVESGIFDLAAAHLRAMDSADLSVRCFSNHPLLMSGPEPLHELPREQEVSPGEPRVTQFEFDYTLRSRTLIGLVGTMSSIWNRYIANLEITNRHLPQGSQLSQRRLPMLRLCEPAAAAATAAAPAPQVRRQTIPC